MHRTSLPIKPIDANDFYVITMVSNPYRYRSRYNLYRKFKEYVASSGGQLFTVEIAYGTRPFEITEPGDPMNLQLRSSHELWHKENALNLALNRLPDSWKYVAWVDADIAFVRPDWVQETVHHLQHYPVVQMWSQALDLDFEGTVFSVYRSFMKCYREAIDGRSAFGGQSLEECRTAAICSGPLSKHSWHPGYAWAARREALDHLGGLIDWAILGSGDRHMAMALIGEVKHSVHESIHPRYMDLLTVWQDRAERYIRRNVGVMPGALYHYWHGAKTSRRYHDRWKILLEHQYNPDLDLKRDQQGLYQLVDRSIGLRDDLKAYFRQRNEDGIEPVATIESAKA